MMTTDVLTDIKMLLEIFGIIGGVVATIGYFRNPQIRLDKKQATDKATEEGKAAVLEQRVQWAKEETDKRFTDMGNRLDAAMTLAQNHTHTVDIKVDKLIESVNAFAVQVGKLETIIDERIPKKI